MNEDDLRKRFQELRGFDAQAAPRFRVPRARLAPRPRLLAATAMILILSAAGLTIGVHDRSTTFSESDRAIVQSVAAWQPPTRFLLRTPGDEILTTTPPIPDTNNLVPLSKGVTR